MEGLGIDPKYLFAQVFNFFLLFILLRKFLYRPIIKVLDERALKIKDGLAAAEKMKAELAKVEKLKAAEIDRARKEAQAIIDRGVLAGKKIEQEISDRAQKEASVITARALAQIESEKEKTLMAIKNQTAKLALLISERMTGKILDEADQARLIDQSLTELEKRGEK